MTVLEDTQWKDAGESSKVYSDRGRLRRPDERAAEMAYRRGFSQGVYMALALAAGGGSVDDLCGYFERVSDWRLRGAMQQYLWAKQPPEDPRQHGDEAEKLLVQRVRRKKAYARKEKSEKRFI